MQDVIRGAPCVGSELNDGAPPVARVNHTRVGDRHPLIPARVEVAAQLPADHGRVPANLPSVYGVRKTTS